MAKRNQHAKLGFGTDVTDPLDAIHLGEGKRIRLDEIPEEGSAGDQQVGNRLYNDERYQLKWSGPVNNQAAFLVGGYWIYSGVGLIFNTVPTELVMPGYDTPFTFDSTEIDLEDYPELDNATFPQYVRPMWDINTGVPIAIFGDASADPGVPSVDDPLTQIAGDEFLLNAGATTIDPGEIQTTVLFNEGSIGEFTPSFTGAGSAIFNDTTEPSRDTIHGRYNNVQNNSTIILTADEDFTLESIDFIALDIKLLAAMGSGHNIRLQFANAAGTPVSFPLTLALNKSNVATYQVLSVAREDFSFNSATARQLRIVWQRTGGSTTHTGFLFDYVIFQSGLTAPVVQGDIILQGQVSGTGQTGTPINVSLTEKAISDQTEQVDPLPSTAHALFRLADGTLRKVAASLLATAGVAGDDGWSPVFGIATDGARRVFQLVDWVGGEGTKPSSGQYVGASGLEADIANGVDIRGPEGDDGREVELRVDGTNLEWRYVGDLTWTLLIDLSTIGGGGLTIPEIVTGLEAITIEEDKLDASAIKNLPTAEKFEESFTWTTGPQEFTLTEPIVGDPIVFVGTTQLRKSKWTISSGVVTITETLYEGALVTIVYLKSTLTTGYPTVNLSGEDFYQESTVIYKRGGNVPQSISGGVELTFRRNTVYGTVAAPASGAITLDLTNANIGAEAVLIYDDTAFTPPSGCVIKPNSEAFDNTKVNIITFRYFADDLIVYDINPFTV